MRINHNLSAMNTYSQLSKNEAAQSKSLQQLSSGKRINGAADDAAGLSISEKMKNQIRGLDQASRNTQDGISMIQTADGALGQIHDILSRMRELTVQAQNGSNNADEQATIKAETTQLLTNIDDIAKNTKFNGIDLTSSTAKSITIQTGANTGETTAIDFGKTKADVETLGLTDFDPGAAATPPTGPLATLDKAIKDVSTARSYLGATQNNLQYTANNAETMSQNFSAASSRITDVDMAQAVMENSKNGILAQAAQAMLAQANQQPQGVLQLLR
ncbi:flagellin [Neobacillus sp. NPDC058068]|uniref:flagellin N-terminal helical domain-containing protein n=1 Tax=Neobacillus sp. NPDC058068 TaxID=3346325 RepID=UPI0036DE881C